MRYWPVSQLHDYIATLDPMAAVAVRECIVAGSFTVHVAGLLADAAALTPYVEIKGLVRTSNEHGSNMPVFTERPDYDGWVALERGSVFFDVSDNILSLAVTALH